MSCNDCYLRKYLARVFDMHWFGIDDCPCTCIEKMIEPQPLDSWCKENKT